MTMPKNQHFAILQNHTRTVLRTEFADFFQKMTEPAPNGWPAISDQEFVDAVADSLIELGKRRGLGVSYAQTLVHELQDRVNTTLSNKG